MSTGVEPPCLPKFEDNVCAARLGQNSVAISNSKYIDARHHSLKGQVASGAISVTHLRLGLQLADLLTKPLCAETFQFHCIFVVNMGWCSCFGWMEKEQMVGVGGLKADDHI